METKMSKKHSYRWVGWVAAVLAVFIAIPNVSPTAAAALLSHARAGRLDRPTLRAAVPAAAAAALAGAWIATGIDVSMLRRPFGIYLLLSGISLLLPRKSKKP